jgi:hypothetical protein
MNNDDVNNWEGAGLLPMITNGKEGFVLMEKNGVVEFPAGKRLRESDDLEREGGRFDESFKDTILREIAEEAGGVFIVDGNDFKTHKMVQQIYCALDEEGKQRHNLRGNYEPE